MSNCECVKLERGLPDVFGFNHPRKNMVVIRNSSLHPFEICENGHKANPGTTWMISKEFYESSSIASNKMATVVAKFGAKQQMLKS